MDAVTLKLVIICATILIAIALVGAAICLMVIGRVAFLARSPASAGAFGLLFLALPALVTIVLIVVATAVLTGNGILKPEACVAIFSSVASFVLGAETQKRRDSTSHKARPGVSPEDKPTARG
jgi:hypothetical protein